MNQPHSGSGQPSAAFIASDIPVPDSSGAGSGQAEPPRFSAGSSRDIDLDTSNERQWQLHADTLYRQFCDHADGKCLLWVDPAKVDPFEGDNGFQDRRIRVRISHPRFDMRLAPYLVPMQLRDRDDAAIFRRSVEIAWNAWSGAALGHRLGHPVAGWIETDENPRWLAQCWANRCHVHRVGGQSWLLRFQDPGVREWLWECLRADQRAALLGSAKALVGFDRNQQIMRQEAPVIGQSRSDDGQRLLLDHAQWGEVRDYATVHFAWLDWVALPPSSKRPLPARWHQEVLLALSHAAEYGIIDKQDRQLFALHALQIGQEFHRSPKLTPVWKRTLAGDFYGSVLDETLGPALQLHEFM